MIPYIEQYKKPAATQLAVANNPEFLREGHCWQDFINADRIVLGVEDSRAERLLRQLYEKANTPVCVVPLNTSEFIKYLSNTVLACLISFSNEMSLAAEAIGGIDIAEAFRILHMDKRWQSGSIRSYFYPGCGYGGYCLPKDTHAFYAGMPEAAAGRIIRAAGADKNTCIGILGLSFNPGSDDVRDTPSAKIIASLNLVGYRNIISYDPVAMENFQAQYDLEQRCVETYSALLEQAETVAVVTAWAEFADVRGRTSAPVVDCRYMLK